MIRDMILDKPDMLISKWILKFASEQILYISSGIYAQYKLDQYPLLQVLPKCL